VDLKTAARPLRRARIITLASLAMLSCVVVPSVAPAGTFQIGWSGDPQSHGLAPKTDLGAPCTYPGAAASALAGTFPGSGGCFFIFNAPGAATIQSLTVTGQFNKASTSPNLCAHSFSDIGSPSPLNLCNGGSFSQVIPVANGRWTEIGLYNKTTTPIAIGTSNANNVNLAGGTITLDDPTPPGLSLSSAIPAFVGGDALGFQFAASDPESRAGSVTWSLDGAGGGGLVADGCADVFVCGTDSSGSFTAGGLASLADGPHTVTVAATSAGGTSQQQRVFVTDHTAPAVTSGLSVDYGTRTVTLLASDNTSGIAAATLYADGAVLPTTLSPALGKPAGTITLTGVIPASARLDGAIIDLSASDGATPANTLDTRPGTAPKLVIPIRPTPPPAAPETSGASGTAEGPSGAASAQQPVTAIARSRGVTLRARGSRRTVTYGQRLWVTGTITVAPGVASPTRVLVIARPLVAAYAKRFSAHIITAVRPDGSYAVRIRPNLISHLRVIALPATGPTHLAELTLGEIGVRARITNVRVLARGTASLTDPTITARVRPAVPGLRLSWLARAHGVARAICSPAEQPVTGARGFVNATCRGTGASPSLRFAVRLTPDVDRGSILLGTTSRWVTAKHLGSTSAHH
jgi:hypothetical protein